MTKYFFDNKDVIEKDFLYVYSPAAARTGEFRDRENSITNFPAGNEDEFDYVSIITKKKYSGCVKISTTCRFDKFGAPLIVFTDDISTSADGKCTYGLHFECVAYKGGCNMWRIEPAPERIERPIATSKIAFVDFEIPEKSIVEMALEISQKTMTACVNGVHLSCTHPDIPEEFHVGITACEGPNSFFNLIIED